MARGRVSWTRTRVERGLIVDFGWARMDVLFVNVKEETKSERAMSVQAERGVPSIERVKHFGGGATAVRRRYASPHFSALPQRPWIHKVSQKSVSK